MPCGNSTTGSPAARFQMTNRCSPRVGSPDMMRCGRIKGDRMLANYIDEIINVLCWRMGNGDRLRLLTIPDKGSVCPTTVAGAVRNATQMDRPVVAHHLGRSRRIEECGRRRRLKRKHQPARVVRRWSLRVARWRRAINRSRQAID